MVGIYKITSPSSKVYIGQSFDFERRMKKYKNTKTGSQPKLFNSFQKYGFDSHEIKLIHELPGDVSQDVLNTYEQLYMDSYRDCGIELLNVREAGSRGKHAEESKRKQSEKMKGVGKGRKQSVEWISKRAASQVGNKHFLGKSHTEETRIKQSLAASGKEKSPEHKLKNIQNFQKATLARIRPVIQMNLDGSVIRQWPSIKDAADSLGIWATSINMATKGKYKTAYGFKWSYA